MNRIPGCSDATLPVHRGVSRSSRYDSSFSWAVLKIRSLFSVLHFSSYQHRYLDFQSRPTADLMHT